MKKTLLMIIISMIFITTACSSKKVNVIKEPEWYEITSVPKGASIGEDISDHEDMFFEDDFYEDEEKIYTPNHDEEYEDFTFKVEIDPTSVPKEASIGEDISDHDEDDFYEDEEKIYTPNHDEEYEDFTFKVEIDPVNYLIHPYWHSIPLSAQSYELSIFQDDEEETYYDIFGDINEYEDTEGEDNVIYDTNAKKLRLKLEVKKQDGTYFLEKRTISLAKVPKIVFPEGDVTYTPELQIKYDNFKGQMISVFLDDIEVAITGFFGSGEHVINLNPEWNHIKIKAYSPSVEWIWEKDVYHSMYKVIE